MKLTNSKIGDIIVMTDTYHDMKKGTYWQIVKFDKHSYRDIVEFEDGIYLYKDINYPIKFLSEDEINIKDILE